MSLEIVKYFSLLFFLSEFILMIAKRSKRKGTKIKNDRMSLVLFWIAITLGLTLGFIKANNRAWNNLNYSIAIIGVCIFIAGIIIRWISIIQLNKEFTVDVAISENHNLNTHGMYKYIRHPSYLGLLLICFGLSVAMNSITSLIVITIPVLLVILYRIKIEEKIMVNEFGEIYKNYMINTYKIIPKLY
jgi:protein-S-isoprenylcysteine O-methyltransferase Ste14